MSIAKTGAGAQTGSPGRPRSELARQAILRSAVALVEENGYAALTMEGIARRAAVSKQTIYRWWPGKGAVVLEALTEAASALAPMPSGGSLETDLRRLLRETVAAAGSPNSRVLAALMAEAQLNDEFARAFRDGFLAQRRTVLRVTFERARRRGEAGDRVDLDLLVDLVFGALWYRILAGHAPLDRRFADRLCEAALELAGR